MIHLRYSLYDAPGDHPQSVMRSMGITYKHATPQSIADQWWFWCCDGYPEPLPSFLSVLSADPQRMIGFGLSQSDADMITSEMAK